MIYIILIGPPGSGKGTQGQLLCRRYGLYHLSTGDVFRAQMRAHTPLGERIQQWVDNGQLVPDTVVDEAVQTALVNMPTGVPKYMGVLLDGYPRTVLQADAFQAYIGKARVGVLHVDVPAEEIMHRIMLRGQSSGRADDQDTEKIAHRFQVYEKETAPVLAYYRKQNRLHTVPGVGEVETIFDALCKQMDVWLSELSGLSA